MTKRITTTIGLILLAISVSAQVETITIGGNVYGGGNHAEVKGTTKVTVLKGDINGVFGGARMANVGGNTFVHIDGEHATGDIMITSVYGGNDISGTIGTAAAVKEEMPAELTEVLTGSETKETNPEKNAIDDTWNTYVRTSRSSQVVASKTVEKWPIVIGSLFAGGNGDFDYTDDEGNPLKDSENNYIVQENGIAIATSKTPLSTPVIAKGYLELKGGCIAHAYGGGNNATVTENTTLCIANESDGLQTIATQYIEETQPSLTGDAKLAAIAGVLGYYQTKVKLNPFQANLTSYDFNFARIYGGNNKAEMAIRPLWNLRDGLVRDLYSGGNKGNMTSPEGLLVEVPTYSNITIQNIFGGCRMADVKPSVNGVYTPCTNLPGYEFPNELSARLAIRGGHITNVYGGNDITGHVYGGNGIGINTTIYGNVYGAGNGAYAYTDMETFKDNDLVNDFYYGHLLSDYSTSYDALNAYRPNAEQVSIRLKGSGPGAGYTIIKGSVFLGGNCASLATKKSKPLVELKIGSYVIADNVFLGNNGEKMTDPDILGLYAGKIDDAGNLDPTDGSQYSTLALTNKGTLEGYMEGVVMTLQPSVVFEDDYEPLSSFVGSFYCGGNVGSMAIEGKSTYTIDKKLNIYNKFVGGCNRAYVEEVPGLCTSYEGGVIGIKDERDSYKDGSGNIKDRIEINLENLTITPLRWNEAKNGLIWNTQKWSNAVYNEMEEGTELKEGYIYYTYDGSVYTKHVAASDMTVGENDHFYESGDFEEVPRDPTDRDIRLLGGNVYGGCYESGHVNGNVVININEELLNKENVFGTKANAIFGNPASGVELIDQRDDLMAVALSVFGGGYGEQTEVWGSTTVNHNSGYMFQIFGGGQAGVVGKKEQVPGVGGTTTYEYQFNPAYSTTVNLKGGNTAYVYSDTEKKEGLPEAEYIYGGGNEGDVCGNTLVNLGNGRIYDAFGGCSDADILGHSEVYIGRQPNGSGGYKDGFPWIRDIVYGGNDFGGTIHGEYEDTYDFGARLRDYDTEKDQLHGYQAGEVPELLKSSSYVEYLAGKVDTIFGGGYGYYDYSDIELYGNGCSIPVQHSSFVNIRPREHSHNYITSIFGCGTGFPKYRLGDNAQDRSYVLIDIPDNQTEFNKTEVYGAGSYNGLGMALDKDKLANGTIPLDEASAIIDLLHGRIKNAYGGSYNEGVTRRTVVNVPAASTIQIDSIFGGAYGRYILPPCDVYESQVNYKNTSGNAQVFGAIFGGNNKSRRTIFTQVNISSPVWSNKAKGYTGTVYGAGRGVNTWAEHTEVNMLAGSDAYEVYGGGEMGHVLSAESVQAYMSAYKDAVSPDIEAENPNWEEDYKAAGSTTLERWHAAWKYGWTLDEYYIPDGTWTDYTSNAATNLSHVSNRPELDDKTAAQLAGESIKKFNTNVIVHEGGVVSGYAYGGGLGAAVPVNSGDVWGRTYVAVLGGEVKKDIYGGGRAGGVSNQFHIDGFTASSNAYVQGGTVRNVYGGGYEGHVGAHTGNIAADYTGDLLAYANVVIGKTGTNTFKGGAPAITRNVYGAGEGGSVYGTSRISFNNGYIGYRYKNTGSQYEYVEELDDKGTNDIAMAGNIFGGGYVVNSYIDNTIINMYGGTVRGSVYGGGEVGPVGRGTIRYKDTYSGGQVNQDARIFKAGTTQVNIYDGHVLRNVYGGGRGKDSWGGDGTMYQKPEVVAALDLQCKGFIFGQTRVNIYGGEIGSKEGMAYGYGNVFGGCDEGSVYSAYMDGNNLHIGKKVGKRYNEGIESTDTDNYNYEGYYYDYYNGSFLTSSTKRVLTEDCKVLVEPHAQALAKITIPQSGGTYQAGDYVPTSDLNKLPNKTAGADYWDNLDPKGIIIHNAVFAGGNIGAGSNSMFANATTVYGNATASIHDVYNRDLITIGTGHTGGLYGDGNLTFVDGYRELNITNYGTDYYHIRHELPYNQYDVLPEREKAYYELKFKVREGVGPIKDNTNNTYTEGSTLPKDEIMVLFAGTQYVDDDGKPESTYWEENGVVTTYAGRIMNTIQRADFCGVFGSRMVMKGAQDRVPEEADYANYTINRVREVSLNKMDTKAGDTGDNALHGNYFGIYNKVNFLGALTSDVKFSDVRTTKTDDTTIQGDNSTTFYEWKEDNWNKKVRNNGNCHNQLALASGVYLELTTEKSKGITLTEKDWGPITGVIELDLINVQQGIGGGFVYARNEHGVPTPSTTSELPYTTLTTLNAGAASKWDYKYDGKFNNWEEAEDDGHKVKWQTSGNFIHSSKTIIDDCYNIGNSYANKYQSPGGVPAHYWYIAGSVYVYDQYISAYTGSANAYRETVDIPITISANANGTLTLMDVQPNLYAYYSTYTDATNNTKLGSGQKVIINDNEYYLNTPISYWDWYKLPAKEKLLFEKETYVTTAGCKIGSDTIYAGTVMLPVTYNGYKTAAETNPVISNGKVVEFTDIFCSSNNISHDTGYLLTYNVTNPKQWDKWYTKIQDDVSGSDFVLVKNQTGGDGYQDGPTYYPSDDGLYGQRGYSVSQIISQKDYYAYEGYDKNSNGIYTDVGDVYGLKQMYPAVSSRTDQASFVPAHLVTEEYLTTDLHYYPGAPVSAAITGYTSPAYIATATIQLSPTKYVYVNDLMTSSDIADLKHDYPDLETEFDEVIVPAYYCTQAGDYGGSYYENGKNYRALEAYSAMSPTDRAKFNFNYDALDLLIDPAYSGTAGQKYQYDSAAGDLAGANANPAHYSLKTPVNYTATYIGSDTQTTQSLLSEITVKRNGSEATTGELQIGDQLLSTVFEALPNEQHHYAPITVDAAGGTYYVVKEDFVHGETPYAVGAVIDQSTYDRLGTDEKAAYITSLTFTADEVTTNGESKTFYYCCENYDINASYYTTSSTTGTVKSIKGVGSGTTYSTTGTTYSVPQGAVISATDYNNLINHQLNFSFHGESPMETSTLYVTRDANINDLSTEKIITVIYKYDYEDSDSDGKHITPVSERHIVNIHINFKSGVPSIEDINPPSIVLPGTGITMRIPTVTPGAYEITGGGWEIFDTESNAESHINGMEYTPISDPLYWYQDGFYLAYYAQTYLGKTYSNHVPVSVANYHDLKKVMDDKKYHLHVDYDRTRLKRDSKIYINDYSSSSENGLQLFKDLYDLSLISGTGDGYTVNDGKVTAATGTANTNLEDHALLNNSTDTGINKHDGSTNIKGVKGGTNLDFFLRTDINYTDEWTPIGGTSATCFEGTFHGDGHTLSGLDHSLFNHLCGNVYNLGVMGTFTGAGVAETGDGYVESCWISTSSTEAKTSKPVFGNPDKSGDYKQIVNSYYMEEESAATTPATDDGNKMQAYTNHSSDYGIPTRKPAQAFYNGEVAYDLNNFYLYKRYCDQKVNSGLDYKYWKTGETDPQTGHYANNIDLCSSGYSNIMYVEERFADGDFRYAAGEIPTSEDERRWIDTANDNKPYFFPIWPDDYIFFGQKLTYGWAAEAHQDVPTAVVRNDGRLSTADDANRVYRAPAYFGTKDMGVFHFNPNTYLAAKSYDGTKTAYPDMTAVDFRGHYEAHAAYGTYGKGNETGLFYTPLLDDDGLTGIVNCDETQNVLIYTPTAEANAKTHGVLKAYFTEPVYNDYFDDTKGYSLVGEASSANVHGHLVQSDKTATNDHLLVDMQDFNCPIAYDFDGSHRMWYQRTPANSEYVDFSKGWQGISVPFTAKLVTTNQKGEITHFYSDSESTTNTGTKIGHEYWLREFKTIKEEGTAPDIVAHASFLYPEATGSSNKTVTNTFLWDYYYKNDNAHKQKDANADTYLKYKEYYSDDRTYNNYPLLTAATPYILGLPGETYYEFDLSGKFDAKNTAVPLDKLDKQVITLASATSERIYVSDTESPSDIIRTLEGSGTKDYTFTFHANYRTKNLSTTDYALNVDGNAFVKVTAEGGSSVTGGATAIPFRPYFTANATAKSSPSRRQMPTRIVFDGTTGEFEDGPESALDGSVEIYGSGRFIIARSHMKEATTIHIVNTAGVTLANFVLQPGETVETPVRFSGVYIANKKKLFIK